MTNLQTPPNAAQLTVARWDAQTPEEVFWWINAQIGNFETAFIESEWLDFKTASTLWFRNGADVTASDRRKVVFETMAEYASAFANTSGGLPRRLAEIGAH